MRRTTPLQIARGAFLYVLAQMADLSDDSARLYLNHGWRATTPEQLRGLLPTEAMRRRFDVWVASETRAHA